MKNSLKYIDLTRIGLAIIMTISMATMMTKPANAYAMYQLDVTYTSGSIISGPLSFGLSSLPTTVAATFTLGPGLPSTEPGEEDDIYFDDEDLVTASVSFGDATWTVGNLVGFDMLSTPSGIDSLTYLFSPINSATAEGPVVLNFPLTITGTDIASNTPFEYQYTASTQTLTPVPEPATMLLFGTSIVGLVGARFRKKKK